MVNINKNARLILKTEKQPINEAIKLCFQNMGNLSDKAKSFDLVQLERNFGKDTVEIVSFKDANGKLLQRVMKSEGENNSLRISEYNITGEKSKKYKISRKTYLDKKCIEEQLDNMFITVKSLLGFNKTNEISKTSFIRKNINDGNIVAKESSLYGFFSNKQAPKKIIIRNNRQKDNSLKLEKVQYCGITKDEAKELAKDPYIGMRLLPNNDFISTLKYKVYRDQDIEKANVKTFKGYIANSDATTVAQSRKMSNGSLQIVLNKHGNALSSKPEIVDSFNHEAKHCRQHVHIEQLDFTKSPIISFLPEIGTRQLKYGQLKDKATIEYAEKMKQGFANYVDPKVNYNAYKNNPVEIEAWEVGKKAKDEYTSFAHKLISKFNLTYEQAGL